jgi:MFS family permease
MQIVHRLASFTRDSRLILIASFLWGMGFSVIFLYLNFLYQGLGFTDAFVGFGNAVPQAALILFALPLARVADRIGFTRAMRYGITLAGAALCAMAFVEHTALVLSLVAIWGIGGAATQTAMNPLLAALESDHNRTYLFSASFAVSLAAGTLGNWLGGLLPHALESIWGLDPKGLEAIQWTVFGAGVAVLAAAVPALRMYNHRVVERPEGHFWQIPRDVRRLFLRILAANIPIGLGAGLIIPFLNIFVEGRFGVSFSTLGALFAWSQLGMAAAMMLQPWIAERIGKVSSMVLVQSLSIPFIIVLGFSRSFVLVSVALVVRSLLMNAANPIYAAFAMEQVPERWRASFSAMQAITWSAGWIVGPAFSGWLRGRIGFDAGFSVEFILMIGLYLVGIAYAWFVLRPMERGEAARFPLTGLLSRAIQEVRSRRG